MSENVEKIVEEHLAGGKIVSDQAIEDNDKEFVTKQERIVLRNCGVINTENIDEYIEANDEQYNNLFNLL